MGWLDTFQRLVDEQVSEKGPVKTAAKLKASDKSVMDQPILRASFEEIEKQKAEEQALTGPTIFGVSIDPTDYLTPGGLAKIGAGIGKSLGGIAIAGTFIGPKSIHWNAEKAATASQELLKGADPKQVWKQTGTLKTPEGLEQEISDAAMRLRVDFDNLPKNRLGLTAQEDFPVGGVVQHNKLYDSYPEILRNTRVSELMKLADWIPSSSNSGVFHSGYGLVPAKIGIRSKTEASALDSTAHEFQHYVDELEGRGRGASPGFFDTDFQKYLNNMSETRARLTAKRRLLTEEERLATYPEFDRPLEDLLIGGLNRTSRAAKVPEGILLRREAEAALRESAPVKFRTNQGSTYYQFENGSGIRDKANKTSFKNDGMAFIDKDQVEQLLLIRKNNPDAIFNLKITGNKIELEVGGKKQLELTGITSPKVGLHPVDTYKGNPHVGNEIVEILAKK